MTEFISRNNGNCGECESRWHCNIDPAECDILNKIKQMNVADIIRSMDDLELAQLLNEICSERDHVISEKLEEQGISHDLIEIPCLSVAHHLAFLRRPASEVFNFESEEDNAQE